MSSALSEVAIKLAVEYLLPYVVQEATSFAARSAIKDTCPAIPSLPAERPEIRPRTTPTELPSVLSYTPGRLRLHVAGLRGNPACGKVIVESLTRLKGVQTVSANDLTGNVLVHFNTRLVERSDILRAMCREYYIGQPTPLDHLRLAGPTAQPIARN